MNVLFIYPNLNAQIGFNYGVASLSAVLKKHGHHTKLINLNEKLAPLPSGDEIRAIIEEFSPGLIGFSLVSTQYKHARKLATSIKKYCNAPIICGGVHATMAPEEVLADDSFDYACVGEGDDALLELVERLEKGDSTDNIPNIWTKRDGQIISNNVRGFPQLETLPMKDYEIFDFQQMINAKDGWVGLMTSRGCPFRCTYCFNHKIVERYEREVGLPISKLHYIRHHSVDEMMREIQFLLQNYTGIKMFIFDDDLFTFDKDYIREFCREYKKVTSIPFVCNAHVKVFDDDMAAMLKEAGCKIVKFGLESGSDRVRRDVLNRRMKNEDIVTAFAAGEKHGLHTSAFVMIGLPDEKTEDIQMTVDLLAEIRPGRFRWAIFYPFPRTRAYEIAVAGGYIDSSKMETLDNFFEDSCLDFGPEQNLFIKKLNRAFPWYVNARGDNSTAQVYADLTKDIDQISEKEWSAIEADIREKDKAISQQLSSSGKMHYAIRFNNFMAVRSDFQD